MKNMIIRMALMCAFCVAAHGKTSNPEQQVDALVKQLMSEKRGTAFQDFFSGSLMAEQKPAEVRAMDAQAKGAWEFYGAPGSYEVFEVKEVGKSLVRIKWLTKNRDEMPLFWSALFYRRAGKWEPLSLLFFDQPEKAGI